MTQPPTASIIIPTYNWPSALLLVLQSLEDQTYKNFEVLIADDGSTKETKQAIETFKRTASLTIQHIWQEDSGFRAGQARNRAAAQARGQLLIFIDGDCLAPPHFVQSCIKLAEPGWFLAGNRVLLSQTFSETLINQPHPIWKWSLCQWRQAYHQKKVNRWRSLMRLPLGPFRKLTAKRWKKCRTCNLVVLRKDFMAVNGFDECYAGWGYEDSDLVIRLLRRGIKHKSSKFAATVIHLWHQEFDRSQEPENLKRLATILNSKQVRAQKGVDQYC